MELIVVRYSIHQVTVSFNTVYPTTVYALFLFISPYRYVWDQERIRERSVQLPYNRVRNEKIACHRFGWMVFQRVQCFDPNTKRTNRKTQTPSYL